MFAFEHCHLQICHLSLKWLIESFFYINDIWVFAVQAILMGKF